MGVIRRQSIKHSIVNYVAVAVGMINLLIIYPAFLTPSEFGQIRYILGTALLIASIVTLGSNNISVRFFPEFRDPELRHHGFLGILAVFPLVGFLIYLIGTLLLSSQLPDAMKQNYGYITSIVFFVLFIKLLGSYMRNFNRIAIPAVFDNLFTKVGVPILVVLFSRNFISYHQLLNLLVVIYILAFLGILLYVARLGNLHLRINRKHLTPERRKRMMTYMSFGILGNLGSILSLRLDSFMVTELLNFERNGVYTISVSISDVMGIPMIAIGSIAAPLIAEKIYRNVISEVGLVYKKSALNLAITGLLFMLIIWFVIPSFFKIMPNGALYKDAQIVAVVLAFGRLIDMITSLNGHIIANSNYFRFNLYIILVVAVLNILGNFILIPRFNIMGAAISTLFSFVVLNTAKTVYVQRKFKIHPFTWRLAAAFGMAAVVFLITSLVPDFDNPYLDLIIKAGVPTILFTGGILAFKISDDINELYHVILKRIGIKS